MKTQIVIIHGGDTFNTNDEYIGFLDKCEIDIERYKKGKENCKLWLREKLGDNYEVVLPRMPNGSNAQYSEWKLWFEKIIPLLNHEIVLIGHSLGASFVAKYLSENKFPKLLKGVFLVSGVFDKDFEGYTLASFTLPKKLNLQSENIFIYHSKDDPIVPFSALNEFKKSLPDAKTRSLEDRQHLNQPEFPEILEDILSLV